MKAASFDIMAEEWLKAVNTKSAPGPSGITQSFVVILLLILLI